MYKEDNLIDCHEVLSILGISRPTLTKYIKAGFIVPTQFSVTGRHRFAKEYVQGIKDQIDKDKSENKELITPNQAADILGVCLATIGEYERKGMLTVAKRPTAHRKLYSKESVEAVLKKGKGKMLTTEELAKEFKCSPSLIAFLDAEGKIKCAKKSYTNTRFYDREAYEQVKTFIESETKANV